MNQKIVLITLLILGMLNKGVTQLNLRELKVENRSNPQGIDVQNPRFSWQLASDKRNVLQTAYELSVLQGAQSIWSSGKINSAQSVFVEYQGSPLKSNTAYKWKLRVWDNQGNASPAVESGFRTALMSNTEWKAKWISSGIASDTVNGIVPMMRKTFSTAKKITNAVAFITSRGLYEAQINGKRVGQAFLTPGWTSYNKHLQYQQYDVTSLVTPGKNAIGVLLGSGWYRSRLGWENNQNIYGKETALLFQMHISYSDGTVEVITSDETWKTAESDITYAEIYNGEMQDARKRQSNWSMVNFNDAGWKTVVPNKFETNYINASVNEPITKHETFQPKMFRSARGEIILDYGQNLVGWVQVKASGKSGDKITLTHFEMMDKHNNPYLENLRTAKAQAVYTLSGFPKESFEPHFTFYGFRYVKLEGVQDADPKNFTAVALYSDMERTGSFETSNELINQLQKNIRWGQKGNFLDVPTDCPQRDERLGWTGDAEVFSRTAAYNFDVNQFFAKWLKDVKADQRENGSVPFVIPNALAGSFFDNPVGAAGWSDASIIIPYNMYVVYGDKRLLQNQYSSMKAYLNYMRGAAKNDLWNTGFQFADWLSYRVDDSKAMIGQRSAVTDNYLVAQCFYAYNTELMMKTARVLGNDADVKDFESLLIRVKDAFQKEYMTAGGRLISETQTAYILALQFDMLPENLRAQAADRLEANIKSYDYHLTTGFLGTPFLNPVLTRFGKNDVAYKLLLQETYPSWLYPIKTHGATTIWERWDSMKPDSTFQDPGMTSFNHYAYGAVGDWMYRTIAGIDTREFDGAGYKEVVIRPLPGGGLTYAKGSLMTRYGPVNSSWQIENNTFSLQVEIPANARATIYLPPGSVGITNDEGKPVQPGGDGEIQIGSGKYKFIAKTSK